MSVVSFSLVSCPNKRIGMHQNEIKILIAACIYFYHKTKLAAPIIPAVLPNFALITRISSL